MSPYWKREVSKHFARAGMHLASMFVHVLLLGFWALVHWLLHKWVERFEMIGFDRLVWAVMQAVSAALTAAPLVIDAYADMKVILIRAQYRVQDENKNK